MKNSCLLIVVICFWTVCSLQAQDFEKFSHKEGFNQNTISSIAKDMYGFLWYGTPNGLIKYDGYEFNTYTTQSKTEGKLLSNNITSLYSATNGLLWIGTNKGINVYIPSLEKYIIVPVKKEIIVTSVHEDSNGRIWFSGRNSLYVCEFLGVDKEMFMVSDNLLKKMPKGVFINDFVLNDNLSLLLATTLGLKKVVLKDEIDIKKISVVEIISYKRFQNIDVTSVLQKESVFWIGTSYGAYKVSLEEESAYVLEKFGKHLKSTIYVTTIFEDKDGEIWFGTKENGLFKYNKDVEKGKHFVYNPKNTTGLASNFINVVFQDDFNVFWIGTAQGGINKLNLNQKPFYNYTNNPYEKSSISDNLLTSILEDNTGKLWISAYNEPLIRSLQPVNSKTINKLKFEKISHRIPITEHDIVRCIYQDKKGFIWIGTDYSLIVYNPTNRKFKKVVLQYRKQKIEINLTRKIIQLDDQNMLFGGNLITVVQNPWSQINTEKVTALKVNSLVNLELTRVQDVLKDGENIWFGTNTGLIHGTYDGEKISIKRKITSSQKGDLHLSDKNVFSLHKKNNTLWVGTYGGGLNKIILDKDGTPIEINFFRENDILPNDAIYGILEDKDQKLWISTDMGIVKFNTLNNTTHVYDVNDGLQQNNFREAAYFKGKSGYFYFGGLKGLTIFKPQDIKINQQTARILISELFVNNKRVKIGETYKDRVLLKKSISETKEIAIDESSRIISFNLTVDHTAIPSKNKLSYKLEGFNEDWIELKEGKAMVTYTNLSGGTYIFKVRAANGDGIWNSNEKTLKLRILPPWYRTWWGYSIFFILITGISVGVIFYFIRHERLKQIIKYDEIVKEKLETINDGKIKYFTNLSHEFRTPLTLISGPLERMVANNSDPNNNEYLKIIQKNTTRLLRLVDQLITFRQAEQGKMKLNYTKLTLGEVIYAATEAFEDYSIEKNINFFHKLSDVNEEIVIDVESLERIIFNLLSNSFKHTPAQGTISVEGKIESLNNKKWIKIDVVDNGKGIDPKEVDSVFERFYQLGSDDGDAKGGGIGLSFCKSLVNLLGGEITAESNPGVETRFSFKIPSRKKEEIDTINIKNTTKSYMSEWMPLSTTVDHDVEESTAINTQKQFCILVVEDEKDIQKFLYRELSPQYNVVLASNGVEALEVIKIKEPDLVVSDVMMPEMDGYEFCEKLKTNPDTWHIPVIMLTALGTIEDTIKGLEYGADEYLSKPFSIKHLELRIDRFIRNNIKIKEHFSSKSDLSKNEFQLSKRDEKFINEIVGVIEKNLSNSEFGVEELSNAIGLSSVQFYRRLKKLTGQVPNVYIRNYRLQRAAELLKSNEGYNVSEVRYQIGIESKSYFSKAFKKLHGVSPSELIKKS